MKLIVAIESIIQNKGGFIIYDPYKRKIEDYYVHDKKWEYRTGWRGSCLFGDYLIATDWTDLHYFNLKKWKYEKTFIKNTFNDLHYIKIYKNKMYIVNTGLDAIEIFRNPLEPEFKNIHFLFEKNKIFEKRNIDLKENYNNMHKIHPHYCHPNAIEISGDKIFVSCFEKDQVRNTGELIELNSGERVLKKNYSCHDAHVYKNDYYTSVTRGNKILVIRDINNKKFPIDDEELIDIPKGIWWRGMVIHNDIAYLFSSDGYRGKKSLATLLILDLKTKKVLDLHQIPNIGNIYFDTVYQPHLFLGD